MNGKLFVNLGRRLASFGSDASSQRAIEAAAAGNVWFSRPQILRAVEAIRTEMLDGSRLERWLSHYPALPVSEPRDVLVVMAGNIPLVGFFDMLCVLCSGHTCLVKPSSKDRALMEYMVSLIAAIDPAAPVRIFAGEHPDAVIATGSDNAVRLFRSRYGSLPLLLRGSRSSVALLSGGESDGRLAALADDIYSYSGLGCRNVSSILLPRDFSLGRLAAVLSASTGFNKGYIDNYRQRRAVLTMDGVGFIDLGHSLLVEQRGFPAAISQIDYSFYDSMEEAAEYLDRNDAQIQCVACDSPEPFLQRRADCRPLLRAVPLGAAQRPSLTDYPDAVDVMEWLAGIR